MKKHLGEGFIIFLAVLLLSFILLTVRLVNAPKRIHLTPVHEIEGGIVLPEKPKVNINTADEALLETLPGIGEALAGRVVEDREANGPFRAPEDLTRVSGIGEATYEGLKDMICTEDPPDIGK